MGFRGAIKKGGGFLNNVDGALVGYEFTARFKGETKDGKCIYFVPSIQLDGADDPIDQHLFVGMAERYTISEDGQSLTMADESPVTFGYKLPFGLFMDSLLTPAGGGAGFDESDLPDLEGGEALELNAIVDQRFRFKQEVDVEATKKLGKRVVGTGKNKREYDRTNTVIDAVLGAAGKAGTKTAAPAAKGKKNDLDTEAQDVLRDVLAKGPINRKNLSLPVTKALIKNSDKPRAAALKEKILDEDWQDAQDFIEVDKKGLISLTE